MKKFIGNVIVIFLASFVSMRYLHLGSYKDIGSLLIFALILLIVNTIIKPVVKFISLPITCLTFGIFSLIVNVLMVMLASALVPHVHLDGFIASAILAIIISVFTTILHIFVEE